MITVFYTFYDSPIPDKQYKEFLLQLPDEERKRNSRFRRWQDQHAHLIGRLLLLKGLIARGFPSDVLHRIKISPYGKLLLEDKIQFNLSHSQTGVVCAITDNGNIGVDMEAIRETDINSFFDYMNEEEWKEIQESDDKQSAFFEYWTKKEAVMKADGRGLRLPFKQVHLANGYSLVAGAQWHLKKIEIEKRYICHLAIDRSDSKITKIEVKKDDLATLLATFRSKELATAPHRRQQTKKFEFSAACCKNLSV